MNRRFGLIVGVSCLASLVVAASAAVLGGCSGDDSDPNNPPDGGTSLDGTMTVPESGSPLDSGTYPDVRPDSPAADAADGNTSTVTTTVGSAGIIQVTPDAIIAEFHADDTIVHVSDAPDCVAYVRSQGKPRSAAGKLTVASRTEDGGVGTEATAQPDPSSDNEYFTVLDGPVLYPTPAHGEAVQVQLAGASGFPAIPPTTLRAPVLSAVNVTDPPLPDGGATRIIDSTKPYVLKWTVADAGAAPGQRVILHVNGLDTTIIRSSLDCSWPLNAGTGTVPSALLSYLKKRAGSEDYLGLYQVEPGDAKEVIIGGASYSVMVSRFVYDSEIIAIK